MLYKELEKLGLNEKEAKVYLAALELGEANIQQIARKSGVRRTTLYDVLESLRGKGLVGNLTKNNKTVYYSQTPQKLENEIQGKREVLKEVMSELMSLANRIERKPKIRFYEGMDGIKEVYLDTLQYAGQELLAWVSPKALGAFDKQFLNKIYLPKRLQKKIRVRAIAPDAPEMQKYKELDQESLRQTKLISGARFPIEVEINLYGGNKIAIMAFEEKISLIIESRKIFNTLKSIFEMNWEKLT